MVRVRVRVRVRVHAERAAHLALAAVADHVLDGELHRARRPVLLRG